MSDNHERTGTTQISRPDVNEARRIVSEEEARIDQAAVAAGVAEGKAELRDRAVAEAAEIQRDVEREVIRKTPAELRGEAMKRSPGQILLLLLIFLISYLIAAATGQTDILGFPRSRAVSVAPPIETNLEPGNVVIGQPGAQTYEVAVAFRPYYDQHNGSRLFGRPLSNVVVVNGREAQWFERARLEHWPENASTKPEYEYQPALVGVEFTQGIPFPNQSFFVSNPELVYSPITNHGVSQRFYEFWRQNGGLDMFGWPISDELQELLGSTGQVHTVQYFERGRLEYHQENAGTENEIMIGLLGRALYLEDSQPNIISAARPTPVPAQ